MPITTQGHVILRSSYTSAFADPDAQAYITAVEETDNQSLEYPVAYAIDDFVRGCKYDGTWDAITACCILAGARTLAGALIPLIGNAPLNVGPFVAGDYDRRTGLQSNGTSKYLRTGRNNNADPQDSKHLSVYKSSDTTGGGALGGGLIGCNTAQPGASWIFDGTDPGSDTYRINTGSSVSLGGANVYPATGFIGISRGNSTTSSRRYSLTTTTDASTSESPASEEIDVFRSAQSISNARLAFYSIGEHLDLARFDARVTTLMSNLAAAIP